MSNENKTIRVAENLGGIAGGAKYVYNGILCKFLTDPKHRGHHLYGGASPNLCFAGKAAANELRAVNSCFAVLYSRGMPVFVPNQLVLEWAGLRLVCMPLVPLGEMFGSRLVLGSDDAGATIHDDDPMARATTRAMALELHLASHCVGDQELWLAGDVEVHARGGELILLDLGRLLPAESSFDTKHLTSHPRSIFWRLLRPEFQDQSRLDKRPRLSSDAFSGWGRDSRPHHNKHARAATRRLPPQVLPALAKELDTLHEADTLDEARVREAAALFVAFNLRWAPYLEAVAQQLWRQY
jgi:hypothetical protein